jgi:hypothetical protein
MMADARGAGIDVERFGLRRIVEALRKSGRLARNKDGLYPFKGG